MSARAHACVLARESIMRESVHQSGCGMLAWLTWNCWSQQAFCESI